MKIPAAQAMQMVLQGQALPLPSVVEEQETSAGLAELPGTGRMRLAGGPWPQGPFQEGEGCGQQEVFVNASPTVSLPG